ncbi:MAG: glycine cleavage system protein GcvH [Elusimicrobiales bacterium]|nr:glycine cleavage system protein GcvH [Elusimicrobiales bacterium]
MPKPEEARYTKTHEWIHPGAEAVVGISDHAQHEMGDVVFVELPKVGQKLEKEKPCAVVESVKSAFDIYSPVSGEVTAVNDAVTGEPALVNQSPLGNGWLFKMKPSNPAEAEALMNWTSYQEFVKQSVH